MSIHSIYLHKIVALRIIFQTTKYSLYLKYPFVYFVHFVYLRQDLIGPDHHQAAPAYHIHLQTNQMPCIPISILIASPGRIATIY